MEDVCITYAIPYYNNKAFLQQTLVSITQQTDKRFKVLISDDCSSEPAEDMARSILTGIDFKYIRNLKNMGMVHNWNTCLKETETQFVTLLHADDLLHPSYTHSLIQAFERHKTVSAIFCGTYIINSKGRLIFSFPDFIKKFIIPSRTREIVLNSEKGLISILRGCFIMCPTVCYRTSIIKEHLFDPRWKQVQDLELFSRYLFNQHSFLGLPQKLYYYRRHSNNATNIQTKSNMRFIEEFSLYNEIKHKCNKIGWSEAALVAKKAAIIRLNILYNLLHDLLKLNLKSFFKRAPMLFL